MGEEGGPDLTKHQQSVIHGGGGMFSMM